MSNMPPNVMPSAMSNMPPNVMPSAMSNMPPNVMPSQYMTYPIMPMYDYMPNQGFPVMPMADTKGVLQDCGCGKGNESFPSKKRDDDEEQIATIKSKLKSKRKFRKAVSRQSSKKKKGSNPWINLF